jgi:hypothetical protein
MTNQTLRSGFGLDRGRPVKHLQKSPFFVSESSDVTVCNVQYPKYVRACEAGANTNAAFLNAVWIKLILNNAI